MLYICLAPYNIYSLNICTSDEFKYKGRTLLVYEALSYMCMRP